MDTFDRPLRSLRLSVTDRCNLRCQYCMPEPEYTWLPREDLLTFEELTRVVDVFVSLGVDRVRLTGGEPLLRRDLPTLVSRLSGQPGLRDLAMTTNGVHLAAHARALKDAGLSRVTVSLDTLHPDRFIKLTRMDQHAAVLQGIHAASEVFGDLKLDTVVLGGTNDDELIPLIEFARGVNAEVRFIEYMDVGNRNDWRPELVVPSSELAARIRARWPMVPLDPNYRGEVAERYAFADGQGEVGFISSVTQPFCGTCSRARLSSDGVLYTCLFATHGTSLRDGLRAGASDDQLANLVRQVWSGRTDRYSEQRAMLRATQASGPKVEMYYIGG